HVDADTGEPLVDVILDQAGAKGTGAWTVQAALNMGVPLPGIAEAVFARSLSSRPAQRAAAASVGLPGPEEDIEIEDVDGFIDDVRHALYPSNIFGSRPGVDAIIAGPRETGWDLEQE